MRTLHIVDGESSGGSLRGFLTKPQILEWRDALYDGPVPGNVSLHKLRMLHVKPCHAPPCSITLCPLMGCIPHPKPY